jgi:hypothetical protein
LLTKAVGKESVVEDGVASFIPAGGVLTQVRPDRCHKIGRPFSEYARLQRPTALLGNSDHRSRLQSIDVARCIHSQLVVTERVKLRAGEEPWGDGDLSGPCGTRALLRCARYWSS